MKSGSLEFRKSVYNLRHYLHKRGQGHFVVGWPLQEHKTLGHVFFDPYKLYDRKEPFTYLRKDWSDAFHENGLSEAAGQNTRALQYFKTKKWITQELQGRIPLRERTSETFTFTELGRQVMTELSKHRSLTDEAFEKEFKDVIGYKVRTSKSYQYKVGEPSKQFVRKDKIQLGRIEINEPEKSFEKELVEIFRILENQPTSLLIEQHKLLIQKHFRGEDLSKDKMALAALRSWLG